MPLPDFDSAFADFAVVVGGAAILTAIALIVWGLQRIRRATIAVAEALVMFMLWLSTAAGAVWGYRMGFVMGTQMRISGAQLDTAILWGVLGGLVGAAVSFAIAAIPFALMFLLVEISKNTQRIAERS